MIVICEECGKKYRIDPTKIKGRAASFKCRQCAHLIMVKKPEAVIASPDAEPTDQVADEEALGIEDVMLPEGGRDDGRALEARPQVTPGL